MLPEIPLPLKRLYQLRARLAGADQSDIDEINKWETAIKKALIFLNLQKHEGVDMLIEKANSEIKTIEEILNETRPLDLSPDGALKYTYETARLHDKKALWVWFKDLFDEAETDLKDAEAFLDGQDDEAKQDKDEYQGQEKGDSEKLIGLHV